MSKKSNKEIFDEGMGYLCASATLVDYAIGRLGIILSNHAHLLPDILFILQQLEGVNEFIIQANRGFDICFAVYQPEQPHKPEPE